MKKVFLLTLIVLSKMEVPWEPALKICTIIMCMYCWEGCIQYWILQRWNDVWYRQLFTLTLIQRCSRTISINFRQFFSSEWFNQQQPFTTWFSWMIRMPDPFGGACEKTKIRLVFDFRGTGIKRGWTNCIYLKADEQKSFFIPFSYHPSSAGLLLTKSSNQRICSSSIITSWLVYLASRNTVLHNPTSNVFSATCLQNCGVSLLCACKNLRCIIEQYEKV